MNSFFAAYQMIKENKRKQKQYDALVGSELNYQIIKDLVNQAAHGVVVSITMKDGAKVDIRREDAFDRFKNARENW
jgi:predicted TIM-barrel enzyme